MKKPPTWVNDFQKDIYSQAGEDGIIEQILQVLPHQDKWCVEFGAWDGVKFSNTRNLIENMDYSGVFIEGNKKKFLDLQANYSSRDDVITLHAYVGFNEDDNLDTLLAGYPVPFEFDFLSIDVDGNDYHIWKVLSRYRPKAVCIEFNPTIPTEVRFVQPADSSINQGNSLLSLVELGKEKGYELISVSDFNAFFVDSKYYPLFEIDDNRPEVLRQNLSEITYVFVGYDGTVFLRGSKKLLWHGLPLKESKIQHLPKFLRKFPDRYNTFERMARLVFWLLIATPGEAVRKIYKRLRILFS